MGRHVGDALTSDGIEKYQSDEGQVKDCGLRDDHSEARPTLL